MKLRWSNGHDLDIQFEANDPDEFYDNCMSALRSFRTATERRVHRGEIHKTVSWCESGNLGVYDEDTRQWYLPVGEPGFVNTESFGKLSISRHFKVEAPFVQADTIDDARADYAINLICLDPGGFAKLDLLRREDSDRIWNLCIGAYQHARDIRSFVDGFEQDFEAELK